MSSIAEQREWVGKWVGLIEPPKLGGWLRACVYSVAMHAGVSNELLVTASDVSKRLVLWRLLLEYIT